MWTWPHKLLTLDFETFWSAEYTLKKLSTEEYVRSSQFKAHGAAVKHGAGPSAWITGADLPAYFATVEWNNTALLCQNAPFDGLVLSHHYKIVPALYLCSLAMSRLVLPRGRYGLDKLAEYFGLPPKGTAIQLTKGWRDLPPHVELELSRYAMHDADLAHEVFRRLEASVPNAELLNIDSTVRMFTVPQLQLDVPKARKLLAGVLRSKRSALRRLGVTRQELASCDKFSAVLDERFAITAEMKEGKPTADGEPRFIPALAKTDPFMKSLLDHEDPDVQALAALRLQIKSTLEETRLRRMLDMATRGPLCIYYNFAGAHTLRWSGGDKCNWQNLPRASELRKCVRAPAGHKLVIRDSSQIEARMLNCLAGQWNVLAEFEAGDPYAAMASDVYGRLITKKEHPQERHVGKVLELGCGYGMGAPRLRETLRRGALGGPPIIVDLDTAFAYVDKYRKRHPKVLEYWAQADVAIQLLYARVENYPWGPMLLDQGRILLPNGTALDYTGITRENGEWYLRDRDGKYEKNGSGSLIRLWGGLVTENVDQALSRVVIAEAMATIRKESPWPVVMTTHDELVCLAPDHEADECERFMHEVMTRRPAWLPNLPLAAEGGVDDCYSK